MRWLNQSFDEIAARRRELFPADLPLAAPTVISEKPEGACSLTHCSLCPSQAGQACSLDCKTERAKLKDGIIVTVNP